jgi:hypothetical protein
LPRLAAQSGVIVHEFLTRLNPRVPRTVSLGATSVEVLAAARASLEVGGPSFRVNSAAG